MDLTHYGPGRPPSAKTVETLLHMIEAIRHEPGIQSAKLAKKVNIPSLQCANYGKRLAKKGVIVVRNENRSLCYTLASAHA